MSVSILPNRSATAISLTTPFLGIGGTGPYTYAVLAGGAGGTINASSGVYTAPVVTGIDTVQVTDVLGAKATASVLVGNPLELVCDIIQTCLGLANGRVYLWDQKISMPTDSALFVVVGVLSAKPFSSNSDTLGVQSVNMFNMLSVDIMSRGPEARDRKEEVVLALQSYYSQSQQEKNSFGLAKLTSGFVNLSNLDGSAIPYRFNLSIGMQYFVKKTSTDPYFGTFSNVGVTTEP